MAPWEIVLDVAAGIVAIGGWTSTWRMRRERRKPKLCPESGCWAGGWAACEDARCKWHCRQYCKCEDG